MRVKIFREVVNVLLGWVVVIAISYGVIYGVVVLGSCYIFSTCEHEKCIKSRSRAELLYAKREMAKYKRELDIANNPETISPTWIWEEWKVERSLRRKALKQQIQEGSKINVTINPASPR